MNRLKINISIIFSVITLNVFAQTDSLKLTADDILQAHFNANGGLLNLAKNLSNNFTIYRFIEVEKQDTIKIYSFGSSIKSKKIYHVKIKGLYVDILEIFNGIEGYNFYISNDIYHTLLPQNITKWDEEKVFFTINDYDFMDACNDYKEKENIAKLMGIENYEGKECYKIKYIRNPKFVKESDNKKEIFYYFSVNDYNCVGRKTIELNEDVIDYIILENVIINNVIHQKKVIEKKNGILNFEIIYDEVKLDYKIDDKDFNLSTYKK